MEDIYSRGEVVSGSISLCSNKVFNDHLSDSCCMHSKTSVEITPHIDRGSDEEKSTTTTTSDKSSSYLSPTLYSQTNLFSSRESDIVDQYLLSLVEQNKDLMISKNHNILIRRNHECLDQVKILSGGSAGHEPLHTGFVGEGMLTAAVIGNINVCPPQQSILHAIRELSVNNDNGIIVICMNYAADRSNFGLAVQMAAREGIRVLCLVVGDDCSGIIPDKLAGRRGLAGIVLVQKIASAMAAAKKTLYEIFYVCQALSGKHLGTINVGLPSTSDKMEVGIGLKGEQGITKSDITDMATVIHNAVWYLLHVASYFALNINRGDSIVLLINNFHMLTDLELNVIILDILNVLFHYELHILRIYTGNYLTCKICYGFSITILKIDNPNLIKWLDYPVQVPGWENKVSKFESSGKEKVNFYVAGNYPRLHDSVTQLGPKFTFKEANKLISMLSFIMKAIINAEDYLNSIDFDHDCGTTMKNFAIEILDAIEYGRVVTETPYGLFNYLSSIAASKMAGMSTFIYFVLFSAAAQAFIEYPSCKRVNIEMFIEALSKAYETLVLLTRAQPGHRTVVDAIFPCLHVLKEAPRDLGRAAEAAEQGAQSTVGMNPSTKLPASVSTKTQMPDAGAEAFVTWFKAACDAFVFSKPEKDIQLDSSSDDENEAHDIIYISAHSHELFPLN